MRLEPGNDGIGSLSDLGRVDLMGFRIVPQKVPIGMRFIKFSAQGFPLILYALRKKRIGIADLGDGCQKIVFLRLRGCRDGGF